jgi:hypothetical protein
VKRARSLLGTRIRGGRVLVCFSDFFAIVGKVTSRRAGGNVT